MVKAMDWEGAEEIAERPKLMLPPQILAAEKHGDDERRLQIPPGNYMQIQQGMQLIEQQKARIDELEDGQGQGRGQALETIRNRRKPRLRLRNCWLLILTHR